MTAQEIIRFWFEELTPQDHWKKDPQFDRQLAERFGALHRAASAGELYGWRISPRGRLAEIIVLDQFSRNIYRDQPASFAQDSLALCLAQEAISAGAAEALSPTERTFLYMPFMHSESALIHEQAMRLFAEPGLEDNFEFEKRHKAIIDRFGRYPHRNLILGRPSTAEEQAFLKQPGSSF